jgi:hypothetical protein
LSHILNAEGEKLQKAVELTGSVCELLEMNKSVQKTIMYATHLEHILYAKLQTALELECNDFDDFNGQFGCICLPPELL